MIHFLQNNYWVLLLSLNYLLAVSAVITILFKNVNPTKTLSYIIVLIMFPFLGVIVYYLFGQEYRKNKIFNRKNVLNHNIIQSIKNNFEFSKQETKRVSDYLDAKVKLVKLLYASENAPLTLSNNISVFKDGNTKFAKLLEDLSAAKHHIHLEYYVLNDDNIGNKIIEVLCSKALDGVQVRLIYDDVGSYITSKTKAKLTNSGVEYHPFMPVIFTRFTGKMNYRNHRKIAIIDGAIGYIGGINIADNYLNNYETNHLWRDTHLRIAGEAIKTLQIHFFTSWDFVTKKKFKPNQDYFPKLESKNNIGIQIAASGPDTDWANIMEAIFTAIVTAHDYVYITTPYFVPNDEVITALQVASKSGVDVRLIIPKESDSWVVKHATNSYLEKLFDANIKVYSYAKSFIHAKTMVVDDVFSTVGTTNMDYRSFNINFEINAFIYDTETSKLLKQHFLEDLENCEIIKRKKWEQRSKFEKLKESFCRLWSPLI